MIHRKPMTQIAKILGPIVKAIQSGDKKVTFFEGAGISTAAGIPDFRSPDTGLYSNLAKLDLPYAEAVFDIDYFKENPKAFYTLAHGLYPGKFMPTKFHYLLRLFQEKKLLKRVYTQNIDTLERVAGIEDEYIVEAHGSFARNHCIECSLEMSTEEFKKQMSDKLVNDGIPTCNECGGYVKPDIVFFGEALPVKFFDTWDEDADEVEIAIVAGTSLTVYPFASLPAEVTSKSLRLLINNEVVGDFKHGKRKTDVLAISDCDEAAVILAELLGWSEELDELIDKNKVLFENTYSIDDKRDDKETSKNSLTKASEKLAEEIRDAEAEKDTKKPEKLDPERKSKEAKSNGDTDNLENDISKLKI